MRRYTHLLALTLAGVTFTASAKDIVHDAEYYVIEAQNSERWAEDDRAVDRKLAAVSRAERR